MNCYYVCVFSNFDNYLMCVDFSDKGIYLKFEWWNGS